MTADAETRAFIDDLASSISHELRTPLAAIVGYAELLATRDDERTRVEAVAQIREAAALLGRKIDEVVASASRRAVT